MNRLFFLIYLVVSIVLSLASDNLNAQWVKTNGPYGGSVYCLAVSGTNLFAGTGGGVFLSTNNGTSWTAVNSGLPNHAVQSLAVSGTNLFAGVRGGGLFGSNGGVFLSTNNGTSWTAVYSGLPNLWFPFLAVSGTNLFAGFSGYGRTGYYGGVILSTNNGTSWTAVNDSLTNSSVNSLAVSGTNLFAGTGGGGVWRRPLSEFITSTEELSTNLPIQFRLSQNYPNPFNPETVISYSIKKHGMTTLRIFDINGRMVGELVNKVMEPGEYAITYKPEKNLSSGVYLIELVSGEYRSVQKAMLLK